MVDLIDCYEYLFYSPLIYYPLEYRYQICASVLLYEMMGWQFDPLDSELDLWLTYMT